MNSFLKYFITSLIIICVSSAQNNVTFLSNLNQYPAFGYNDIWGYVDGNGIEYALLGCVHGTSIIRVDNPTQPQEVAFIPGPTSSWRDIKTHSTYAYIVTEGTGTGRGLQIVDLSQLPNSATLVNTIDTWFIRAHNIFIDNGYAYVIGTDGGGGMHILNLSNPTNPTRTVYYTAGGYIHDVYVWNDTVVTCNGSSQVYQLLDVTNKSNPQLISSSSSLPGIYAHSGWMTSNKRYFIACEEFNVRDITVWDLVDKTSWELVVPSWQFSTGNPIIHNLFVRGNFAHISYYTAGYVVIDISDPTNPQLAGQYDTYPQSNSGTYNGAWGCYPYLPSGNVLISDIETGLYVLHFDGEVQTFQLSVVINNGWNMVSVPGINPAGMGVGTWWPGLTGTVWGFNGTIYVATSITTPGIGYWMKHIGATTYDYPAIEIVAHDPIAAHTGWNMIGGYEASVPTSGITTTPTGQQTGIIWGFNGTIYEVANTLVPGYSYWIKLLSNCQINIPEAFAKGNGQVAEYFKEDWGRIILTDASGISYTLYAVKGEVDLDQYEMPPALPSGMFDIRFGSGRIAEDLKNSFKTIEMKGVEFPVTIRTENINIRLQDDNGNKLNAILKSGEELIIRDPSVNKLKVTGENIPAEYSLEQNYPNPFNPITTIEFSLPEDVSNVKLSIYNALGEKVAELVNTSLVAGRYSYQWNADNAANGVYIYEMKTEIFVSIRKMILLR